jgi:hypothetical protein
MGGRHAGGTKAARRCSVQKQMYASRLPGSAAATAAAAAAADPTY